MISKLEHPNSLIVSIQSQMPEIISDNQETKESPNLKVEAT